MIQIGKAKSTILYVLPYPFYFTGINNVMGGHVSHIRGVVEALLSQGYRVKLISDMEVPGLKGKNLGYHPPMFLWLRGLLKKTRAYGIRGAGRLQCYLFCIGLFLTTFRKVHSSKISFIYVRHNLNGFIPALVARLTKVPLVLEVNTPISMGIYNQASIDFKRNKFFGLSWKEKYQYKISRLIIAITPLVKDWIVEIDNNLKHKIVVSPNGVDTTKFSYTEKGKVIRSKLGINANEVVIGMAGVFVWYNAVEELIDTFSLALQEVPDLYLLLIGDSELKPFLENYVRKKGLENRVIFTGMIPFNEMPDYLSACDIFASYFNYKDKIPHNCSMKHLEYLAMGRPTIATDIGNINFAIEHNKNGFLVKQGDIEGFAEYITKLAKDKSLRERLGKQAREDAKKYTWQANVTRVINRLNNRRVNKD